MSYYTKINTLDKDVQLDALKEFILYWLEDEFSPEASEEKLNSAKIPSPLKALYSFAPASLFGTQDSLRSLNTLELDHDKLMFVDENQWVWNVATLIEGDDPPVWYSYNDDGKDSRSWIKTPHSLTNFLITFCFQELTFGAKFGVWDDKLSDYFRSGDASIMEIWRGDYLYEGSEYIFYLMDERVLVGKFFDDSLFFGANSQAGIEYLKKLESPITHITLSTHSSWQLDILQDGSARLGIFGKDDCKFELPHNIFIFDEVLEKLQRSQLDHGDSRKGPLAFFQHSGRGYSQGIGISDTEYVKGLFSAAFDYAPEAEKFLAQTPLDI